MRTIKVLLFLVCATTVANAALSPHVPQHHNIPATLHEDMRLRSGDLVYVCATLPRPYVLPTGQMHYEEDHYIQLNPCPAVLIK